MTDRDFKKILETLKALDTDSISLYQRILEMSESALESETNTVAFMKEQRKLNTLFKESLEIQEKNNQIFFETIEKIIKELERLKNE